MSVFKLFETPKPKQFKYKPVYYDERKENLQKRIEAVEKEMAGDKNVEKPGLEHGFIRDNMRKSRYKKENQVSSLRVVLIMIILCALLYLLLFWF